MPNPRDHAREALAAEAIDLLCAYPLDLAARRWRKARSRAPGTWWERCSTVTSLARDRWCVSVRVYRLRLLPRVVVWLFGWVLDVGILADDERCEVAAGLFLLFTLPLPPPSILAEMVAQRTRSLP